MIQPTVTGESSLSNSFVGNTKQICLVTRDIYRTMAGLVKVGIGPWSVYTFGPDNCTDSTYRGEPSNHTMRVALAFSGEMMWEVIQPLEGRSIYTDFLDQHGEGIHHIASACDGLSYAEQLEKMQTLGYNIIQSGVWAQGVPFAYFDTEGDMSTTIELFDIPEDFDMPEPEEWFPAAPPAS
jgi:methylmalonyl-CoA/ethylmalonyl-CoA epimerase